MNKRKRVCRSVAEAPSVPVPCSDSKLTLLVSSGLGSDSQTSVVVCGAQEGRHIVETIAAMRFGLVRRGISNLARAFQTIKKGVAECESKIKGIERWKERDASLWKGRVGGGNEEEDSCGWGGGVTALVRQKMELTGDNIDNVYAENTPLVQGFGNAHEYGMGNKAALGAQRSHPESDEHTEGCATS